jgi:hypothetical protein
MDLRRAVSEYVNQGRELLKRLRSPEEGPTATDVDLHILRVQLFLLDHEAANMQRLKNPPSDVANVPSQQDAFPSLGEEQLGSRDPVTVGDLIASPSKPTCPQCQSEYIYRKFNKPVKGTWTPLSPI